MKKKKTTVAVCIAEYKGGSYDNTPAYRKKMQDFLDENTFETMFEKADTSSDADKILPKQ